MKQGSKMDQAMKELSQWERRWNCKLESSDLEWVNRNLPHVPEPTITPIDSKNLLNEIMDLAHWYHISQSHPNEHNTHCFTRVKERVQDHLLKGGV